MLPPRIIKHRAMKAYDRMTLHFPIVCVKGLSTAIRSIFIILVYT